MVVGGLLGQQRCDFIYGAAGSLITVLLWVYYSSLIFFLGAEFTQVYARRYGSGFVPADTAASVALHKAGNPERNP